MEYFWLKMDKSLSNSVLIAPLTPQECHGTRPVVRMITVNKGINDTIFHDYLTTASAMGQYHVISERLKKLIALFKPNQEWVPVVLIDQYEKGHLYWFLDPVCVDCLSGKTEFAHDRTIKKLIIQEQKVEDHCVFQIQTSIQKANIVRIDLAESMLRRGFLGIDFVRVGIEEEV